MKQGMKRAAAAVAVAGAVMVLGTGSAFANDCVNLSRNTSPESATKGGKVLQTPFGPTVTKGHWVYLGDVWLFVSPGTESLLGGAVDTSGLPGADGNFSGVNDEDALLAVQGVKGGAACERPSFGEEGIAGACGAGD